ncbi:TonB-dependent siderophore receptor [Pseudoduganella albidiflava]|uniref:Ferrioxamine receptor FoxA n=1 Tax=Pseudoduganella albidiflava TaxID=321983 RepID=A0A411WTA0_9BURK|nr:TonB-dependent siderophore receptor [Pseudoduganella albidiflava]QBI00011.1 TonB-dependent siderophore receptor [Pseudoduganella albidiflava]GGY55538.1 ferrioxamine receptor FoxA [Pseudoduganella albidiflava]
MTRNSFGLKTRPHPVSLAIRSAAPVALAAALLAGGPAFAQPAAAPTVPVSLAAQPLAAALNELARQAGLELIVEPGLVAGRAAPAVAGTMTARQALDRLLAGSGLVATVDGNTVVVSRAPDTAAEQAMAPITVTAAAHEESGGAPARRTVSASKTDTPILETPQSVSVITAAQLDAQKPRSIGEVLGYTPGAFAGLAGSSNRYDYVALRGFADSSVDSTLLDGQRLLSDQGSYSSMQVDPFFLERIDVLRGPASVLYGRASPGGLVALTSKTAQFTPQRSIGLTVGNRNRREGTLDLTGPLGDSGTLAWRVTALARQLDSQFTGVKEERLALAPSLTIRPSKQTSLRLHVYLQRDPEGSYHSGVPADASVGAGHNGQKISRYFFDGDPSVEEYRRDQRIAGYQLEHAFNDTFTFRQNARYVSTDTTLRQVYGDGWSGPRTLARYYSGAGESTRGHAIDNQLEARLRSGPVSHILLAGLDYQKRHVNGRWDWGTADPIDVFAPVYGAPGMVVTGGAPIDRHLRQTGVYVQDQMAIGRWRLTLGGRDDRVEASNQMAPAEPARWKGSRFTKRAGAVYLFDNGVAPYASWSDGFNPSLRNDRQGNNLPPTETEQVEAGIRYQPEGGATLLSAAVYQLKQSNVATQPAGFFYFVPAGAVRARGLELEARTQLADKLSLLASYTFNDMTFQASPAGYQGNTPYQAPRHMASAWADWNFLPGYSLGAGVRHVGTSWGDNANTFKVPSYVLADLALNVDLGRLGTAFRGASLRLNASNLFDKTYVASCMSASYCYWGDARNVSATLAYQW